VEMARRVWCLSIGAGAMGNSGLEEHLARDRGDFKYLTQIGMIPIGGDALPQRGV
jgi:hypothetical protein